MEKEHIFNTFVHLHVKNLLYSVKYYLYPVYIKSKYSTCFYFFAKVQEKKICYLLIFNTCDHILGWRYMCTVLCILGWRYMCIVYFKMEIHVYCAF